MSELGYLFHDSPVCDLDVERSQLCKVLVAKTRRMSNPVTQQKDLLTIIYALTTVKGASVK